MILCANTPCDETTHNSHVIHTHYNNVRYIEWITRVNGARCLTTRHTRECHVCKKVGHIAKNCPNSVATPSPLSRAPAIRTDNLAAHKTAGHTCESCKKPGHTSAQCWSAHPKLVPEALIKKRQAAMSATLRERQRASDYASPGYQFQGMALTYKRPLPAMVQRRSTRPSQPTVAAREAASQRPERRVRFTPSTMPQTQPTTS